MIIKTNANLLIKFSIFLSLTFFATTTHAKDNEATKIKSNQTLIEALTGGTPYLNMRYRYEFVRQDNIEKDANASTLATIFGYKTGEYKKLSAVLAIQDISEIGSRRYNDTIHTDKTNYATVGDPQGTSINEAYINWNAAPKTNIRAGIQEIDLDNKRFIGAESWRQGGQTFDAVSISSQYFNDISLSYIFIDNVNRAFADSAPLDEYSNNNINLFNVAYDIDQYGQIIAYDYIIDMPDAKSSSSQTYGVRFDGSSYKFDDNLSGSYQLEYAHQKDYGDNSNDYSTDYILAEAEIGYKKSIYKIGIERLGANRRGDSFQTPLASLHNFNGWADKFITTPTNGLLDFYATIQYKINSEYKILDDLNTEFTFHNFSSRRNSIHYGEEYDFLVKKNFKKHYNAGLKLAHYQADERLTNTTKIMVFTGLQF